MLQTSEGWRRLKAIAAQEGLVAISFERQYEEWSRVYAFAKTLLFTGEGRVVGCPISMTDGCARVLELSGTPDMKEDLLQRLISRDPNYAFTAGQFMTERPGGSDVSLTETVAIPEDATAGKYRLNGFKWFSSATDSQVALALARTGDPAQGSRSLSLFLLPLRLPLPTGTDKVSSDVQERTNNNVGGERENNGVFIHRLKSKIGTHSLPTAELSLENSVAYLIGPLNGGVKAISTVLQITRVHSSFDSVGSLARCFAIAQSFAKVRRIDGGRTLLEDVPLHVASMAKIAITYRALLSLALNVAHLLGQCETFTPGSPRLTDANARFRLLNPTVKAFATYHCVPAMEECMAAMGGQGYMEETGIGRLIRDALVEKIWEGTENVLALDLVRAADLNGKSGGEALGYWKKWAAQIITSSALSKQRSGMAAANPEFAPALKDLESAIHAIPSIFKQTAQNTIIARTTLLLFGHATTALYMLEHAIWAVEVRESDSKIHVDAFVRWVLEGGVMGTSLKGILQQIEGLVQKLGKRAEDDKDMVFGKATTSGLAKL
jgi:alkylation response protein AidB-like acyl-CoA dehydrogenase